MNELIFIPLAGLGHLVSAIEFAKLILNRDENNLCISVLIMKLPLDYGVQNFIQSLTSQSRLKFIDISLDEKTSSGFLNNHERFVYDFIDGHKSNVREYVQNIPRLAGFVLDMFCTSMIDIANEFNVPSYIYFASNAAFLGLCLHFQALRNEQNLDTSKYVNSDEELSIPCFKNPCPTKVLPKHLLDSRLASTLFFDGIRRFKETKGIIINTFFELEPFSLQTILDSEIVPTIYPVGPVVSFAKSGHFRNNPSEIESIMEWLDEQPDLSVVFLCFGSMGSFEAEQIKEIAIAMEHCGQRFLWSLRRSPPKGKIDIPSNYNNFEEILPKGFLERTKGIGKVIGWAPQVAILSHKSVGGFVSHCGWNSILESVYFGVPIATWPLYAEQQMNAFLLVKELGLAKEIRMDYVVDFEGKDNQVDIVSAEEIEGGLQRLMVKSGENEVRKKTKEMKEKSRVAMVDGGSSYNFLGLLINDVITNIS
ncbi:anthocyanidin 3-O-glucosyltransferase 2-like [Nicotiana tomentosiformis]|uniref:anthocyanidin 3-O-glucosyltransferase 2-like n=1 Tax=Nicotiana tomentosiformis TaxID=4098 RepID=UPI00051C78D8|nr:anthocyanidin 3-O-glucosyltransferase 2-like [Nicotiana tomentosiformis]